MPIARDHYAMKTKARDGRPNYLWFVTHHIGPFVPCIVSAPSQSSARTKVSRAFGNGRISLYRARLVEVDAYVPDIIDGPTRVKCVPSGYIEYAR